MGLEYRVLTVLDYLFPGPVLILQNETTDLDRTALGVHDIPMRHVIGMAEIVNADGSPDVIATAKGPVHPQYFLVFQDIPGDDRLVIAAQAQLGDIAARFVCGDIGPDPRCRRRFREEPPEVGDSPFPQWFLEPTDVSALGETVLYHDEFAALLSSDWDWQDIFDDCSFTAQNGLEIHAANGRHLWHANLSAPRILRSASGDLAVQTVCAPASDEKLVIGGLLLWKDKESYLRLDRGTTGEHHVFFGGCLGNQDVIIGRGRLESANRQIGESASQPCSGQAGRVFLRLERIGDRVDALCSADGERWFSVGHVRFPVEDPVQVGLYAIGSIDRTIYHGAYPDGTAIRFESFQLWGLDR
jgi:hypothetical protein